MVGHARSALVSSPIVQQGGAGLVYCAGADVAHVADWSFAHVVHHDLMISVIFFSDSFSAATLNALNTSTADLCAAAFYTRVN